MVGHALLGVFGLALLGVFAHRAQEAEKASWCTVSAGCSQFDIYLTNVALSRLKLNTEKHHKNNWLSRH